jgi:outer membrane protein TolC
MAKPYRRCFHMKRIVLILAVLPYLAMAAWAQETLGVEEAVRLALANNASLVQSSIALDTAKRTLDVSWNGLLPSLSVGAGASRPNVPSPGSTGSGESYYGTASAGISLSTAVMGSMQVARSQYDSAGLAFQVSRRDVELSVRKAYYSILLTRESMLVIERSIETAQNNYNQAEVRRKAGLAPELDSLTALVALEKIKPTLASAQVTYENQLADFRQLMGMAQDQALSFSDSLDTATALISDTTAAPSEETVYSAKDKSPAVTMLAAALALARTRKAAADRAVYSPGLSLSMSYRPTWSNDTSKDSGSVSAVLSFSTDKLLPWSQERQAAAVAADSVATAESKLAEARIGAGLSAKSLARRIAQARGSLRALRLNVTLAERTYALTDEAYRFGTKDVLAVQNAQDNLQSARMQVLSQMNTLISAVLDLEYALGVPFGTLGRQS